MAMKTAIETCRRRYTGVFRDVEQGFKSLHLRQTKPSRFYGLGGFILYFFGFPGNSELITISYLQSFCSVGNSKGNVAIQNGNEIGNRKNGKLPTFFIAADSPSYDIIKLATRTGGHWEILR